jgi:acyl transferase domain-containing protein
MRRAGGQGAMTSVQLPEAEAQELAGRHGGQAVVAVCNSPNSTVLAGDAPALRRIEDELSERNVFWRRVNARVAAHGPAMDPLLDELVETLADVRPRAGAVPIQSTVHGRATLGTEFDAEYWARNLREPVRFCDAVQNVLDDRGPVLFLEMSPHPLLSHSLLECAEVGAGRAAVISSLRRDDPGLAGLLNALAQFYEQGGRPDWAAVTGGGRFVPPPSYPWQRERFNVEDAVPSVPARLVPGGRRQEPGGGYRGNGRRSATTRRVSPEARPGRATDQVVREEAAIVLGMAPELIDPDLPLTLLGLDSVMAAALSRRIGTRTGVPVRVADLLGGGTLRTLGRIQNKPALVPEA